MLILDPTITTSSLAIDLQEAKDHLNIIGTADDAKVTLLIKAAALSASQYTGRAWVKTGYLWISDRYWNPLGHQWSTQPAYQVYIPIWPITSITSVTYSDSNNADVVLTGSQFLFDPNRGQITAGTGVTFGENLRIVFVAGVDPPSIPEDVKSAMKLIMADMYLNAEASMNNDRGYTRNPTTDLLLSPYRLNMGV